MKHHDCIKLVGHFFFALVFISSIGVNAQEPPVEEPVTANLIGSSEHVEGKLSNEFAGFLGGENQAADVVDGLRQGISFSLETVPAEPADTTPAADAASALTIEPPTGTMGYGNVRKVLTLAQSKLAELDITQPTSEQLSAVLVGGVINGAQVDGILTMRAEGMGWGEIAHQYDTKVGQLMGNGKGAVITPAPSTTTTISNATGKTIPSSKARSNGYIHSGKTKAWGQGIVSGSGNQVGSFNSSKGSKGISTAGGAKGKVHTPAGKAHGVGIVSASGNAVGASAISAAGGKGFAKGHSKKGK